MTRSSLTWCFGIAIAAIVLVAVLHAPLDSVEDQFTMLKYRVRGAQPADTNIVIVYIDNEAIRTLGWPVRRNFYALMINTLSALQVKAVGVEIQFEDARLGYPEYPEYDDLLASMIGSSRNVVLTSYFDAIGGGADTAAINAPVPAQFNYPRVNGSLPEGKGLHLPLPRFREGAAGVGHVNFAGASGIDIPVLVHRGSGVVPAFAAEVLRLYCHAERSGLIYSDGNLRLEMGSRYEHFATSSDATVQLNLPSSFNAYTRYPFLEVLRSYDALRLDKPASTLAKSLKDKLVLVGVVAEGRSDFRSTPVDPRFPSIGLHAAFVDNALHSRFLHTTGAWIEYLLCILLGLGSAVTILFLPSPWNKALAFGAVGVVTLASFFLFAAVAVQLPFVPIVVVGLITTVSSLFFRQRQMKEHVDTLQAEKQTILAQLSDREAKVALLERELLDLEAGKKSDRTEELLEEIRRYKAEIFSLSSQAGDLEEYQPEETTPSGAELERIIYDRAGKMKPVVEFIKKIADSDAPVLILGESGTGKELVARAICKRGPRASGPFIAVNCGALSEGLLESELFGHEKGAFTGAVKDKLGRFELADQGTIFLDEIAEVSEGFQLKLLRVLQEGEFERVGGTQTVKVNVRLLAATNKDLLGEVNRGKFREDLYYRVNVLTLSLPPLRDRKSDIPILVDHFLKREGDGLRVSRNVIEILQNHPWRGNIRELESTIKRAALLCKAEKRSMITARDLGEEITAGSRNSIPVQDQVLDLLREKGFSRSSIAETAGELGGLNRGTVAEYFRGECLKAFEEQRFEIEAAVRHISLSVDENVNERVRKKLNEYLANIANAVDVSQPWENSKAALKPKAKNLPQRYHPYLEQVAEAYFRGLWKLVSSRA
jgi:transcriptional regulator with GAF, ATPase, and Fis domain/CHASE2 domain-containing sensor protein